MSLTKNSSMGRETKSTFPNDLSITDSENFEPPQLSSTPFKIICKSKRILKNSNRINISVVNKKNKNKKDDGEIDCQLFKSMSPIVNGNFRYDRKLELFSDLNESIDIDNTTMVNDSDIDWITFSDVSENKSYTNVSNILAEIGADEEIRFDKPPRRSYLGRKRNNTSLYKDENEKEKEEIELKMENQDKKPKQKKYTDPQDEVLIQSINEHFNDVDSFSLAVE